MKYAINHLNKKVCKNIYMDIFKNLPFDIQVRILKEMSKVDDEIPIEINGDVFMIPQEVNELIDNLFIELQDLKLGKKINKE